MNKVALLMKQIESLNPYGKGHTYLQRLVVEEVHAECMYCNNEQTRSLLVNSYLSTMLADTTV